MATLNLLDVETMLTTEPEPVPWLVEDFIVHGTVTMLAGREGQGKSMLALAVGSGIGHGKAVAGMTVTDSAKVLVVDAENGPSEAHRRIIGLDVKPGALAYAEAVGFNLSTNHEELAALIDAVKPTVLILDSLRSLAPGLDENDSSSAEMVLRPVVNLVRERGVGCLVLHHAGKGGHDYRGSTALGAAVELGFTLGRHPDDPEGRTRRYLKCWKCRPAAEPDVRWLSLDAVAGYVSVNEAEPFEPTTGSRVADALVPEVIDAVHGGATSGAQVARLMKRNPDDKNVRVAVETAIGNGDIVRKGKALHPVTPVTPIPDYRITGSTERNGQGVLS